MVIHLIRYSFRKGEEFKYNWDEHYLNMYKQNYFQDKALKRTLNNIKKKSRNNNKYRLMLIEIEKGHKEPFSREFMDAMVEERFANELLEEVNTIFGFKERREYKKFPFDDHSKISRRLQFTKITGELTEIKMNLFYSILFMQYEKGLMKHEELNEWKPKLITLGFLDDKERPTTVNSISDALKTSRNEIRTEQEEMPIVIREVTKKKTARFDSK